MYLNRHLNTHTNHNIHNIQCVVLGVTPRLRFELRLLMYYKGKCINFGNYTRLRIVKNQIAKFVFCRNILEFQNVDNRWKMFYRLVLYNLISIYVVAFYFHLKLVLLLDPSSVTGLCPLIINSYVIIYLFI